MSISSSLLQKSDRLRTHPVKAFQLFQVIGQVVQATKASVDQAADSRTADADTVEFGATVHSDIILNADDKSVLSGPGGVHSVAQMQAVE